MSRAPARRYLFYVEQNYCFDILRPIQDVVRDRGGETAWFAAGSNVDRTAFRSDEQVFGRVEQTIGWNPDAVLVPGNFVPAFIPGIKVMVTHGLISGKRRNAGGKVYHFIERGLFDLYITHGPNSTITWQKMARKAGYFQVAECGWSKLDPLFDGSRVRREYPVPVVYFASTFSPRLAAAPWLVETVAELSRRRDWHWLVHFHPKMPTEVTDHYRAIQSDRLTVVNSHDTLQLLLDADVMLCDTSSIISEFAVLNKPVVTFRNLSPMPFMIDVHEPHEIEAALQRALERPTDILEATARHVKETHPWSDGRSSERILDATDALVASGLEHLRPKPRNLIRHLKMRRELQYYRLS